MFILFQSKANLTYVHHVLRLFFFWNMPMPNLLRSLLSLGFISTSLSSEVVLKGVFVKRCSENMQQIYRRTRLSVIRLRFTGILFYESTLRGCFVRVWQIKCLFPWLIVCFMKMSGLLSVLQNSILVVQ